jgi:hypothetical protein
MDQHPKISHSSNTLCREAALARLSRYGIEGKRVYLIDLIPLIEMIWAGGQAQAEKIDFLYNFIKPHISHINRLAGYEALSVADAINFTAPYLASRPNMAHLKKLRECIIPLRFGEVRSDYGDMVERWIVSACRNILSTTLTRYPHELRKKCCSEEGGMFLDILETFSAYHYKEDKSISE